MKTALCLSGQLNISIIVPVYNGGKPFLQCLQSLSRLDPPPFEIVVAGDGDTDGSSRLAAQCGVEVVHLPARQGPARARNFAARHAKGDILFFLDADVTVPSDILARLADIFEREPGIDAVIGSYDDRPAAENFLSQYKNLLHHYVHQTAREEGSTFWGACGAIRRDVFVKIGGFDERYVRPSVEDIELGYRLKRAGHRILLGATLQVKHFKRYSFLSLIKSDIFDRALPWTKIIWREGALLNDLNLRMSERVSVMAAYGLVMTSVLAIWLPECAVVAGGFCVWLLFCHARLYGFFYHKRGLRFALAAIPWHWLYLLYSGLAFAGGSLHHWVSNHRPANRAMNPLRQRNRDKTSLFSIFPDTDRHS